MTQLLEAAAAGDQRAAAELFPLVYQELRALAQAELARLPSGHTLQATALVHEAWMRLAKGGGAPLNGRAHFFALAAMAIRQILIDHARRKTALKRGGDRVRVEFDHIAISADVRSDDLLALDEALEALSRHSEQAARIINLRYFAGLTVAAVAELLDLSPRTVEREWEYARAWLRTRIGSRRLGKPHDRS